MTSKKSIARVFSVLSIITLMLALIFIGLNFIHVHAAGVRYAAPGGTGDCSSWADACTVQTALTGATAGEEIWAAAGTYKPTTDGTDRTATFQLKSDVTIYGGFAGTENSRSQRDPAANLTVLSGDIDNNDTQTPVITDINTVTGNNTNSYHVVTGADGATLDGFTITAGYADGAYPHDSGGGMYNSSSNPTLANLTFSGNTAVSQGGGIYDLSASPALTYVTFSGNSASSGGGMYNSNNSGPTLTKVTFNGNSASPDYGAGGGMHNDNSDPTLTMVTFSGNSACYGGGMYNNDGSNPTLTDVTFNANSVSGELYAHNSFGGGMENISSNPTLTNVTFSDNSSAIYAGGMYNADSSPILTNVTFSGNSAEYGGGMYNYYDYGPSTPAIRNTIFWGNTASEGAQIDNNGGNPSVMNSVVEGGYVGGTNIINADPLLGALGDNGGFTQTIPLLPGSSAIDTGNNATCATRDQRGYVRPVDGDGNGSAICDIGAYEAGAKPPVYVFLPLVLMSGSQITPTLTPGTITPTATPTLTPTTQPPSGPQDGGWSVSSSNVPISGSSGFRVSSGSIPQFGVWIFNVSSPCLFLALHSDPTSISGGAFSFSDWGGDFVVSGTFTSSTTASGTIHLANDYFPNPACHLSSVSYYGTWSGAWANP